MTAKAKGYAQSIEPEVQPQGAPLKIHLLKAGKIKGRVLAGDPPDIMLMPKLSHIGLLEFYRAKEAMQEGRECVLRLLPEIRHVLGK